MSCKQLEINGYPAFICSDIGGYMSKEVKWWQENIKEYKETFIEYMDRSSKCGVEHAKMECEAHIENIGLEDLSAPEDDADECMSYWDGE